MAQLDRFPLYPEEAAAPSARVCVTGVTGYLVRARSQLPHKRCPNSASHGQGMWVAGVEEHGAASGWCWRTPSRHAFHARRFVPQVTGIVRYLGQNPTDASSPGQLKRRSQPDKRFLLGSGHRLSTCAPSSFHCCWCNLFVNQGRPSACT